MAYVDGFLIPVPRRNRAAYVRLASRAARIWKDHGALEYRECIGDDLNSKGMGLSFPKRVKAKAGETVVFSWIVYRSRSHRDAVNKRVMKDPRMLKMMNDPKSVLFDGKRMSYGGFKVIVDR